MAAFMLRFFLSSASFEDRPPLLALEHDSIYYLDGLTWTKHTVSPPVVSDYQTAVDYDWKRRFIYYSTLGSDIYRIKFEDFGEPNNAEMVLEDASILHFTQWAIDWVHNNIYWVDVKNNDTLFVMDLASKQRKTLTVLDLGHVTLRQVVLDPFNKYIYFLTGSGIDRIKMDGTFRETVTRLQYMASFVYNTFIAIDYENDRIYYNDVMNAVIRSINTNGTDERVALRNVYDPKHLQVYQGNLYFLKGHGIDMLYKLDPETNTLNEIETNEDMVLSLQDYKIFHPFAQKEGKDPCGSNNGGCSHLCLPKSHLKFTCECPDNMMKQINICFEP